MYAFALGAASVCVLILAVHPWVGRRPERAVRRPSPTRAQRGPARGSAPGPADAPLQLDQQFTELLAEFAAGPLVEAGEHGAFVRQLPGQ